ncbi:hypothetical protein ACFPJ1_40415 [Kribbella qitaiheensis]
MISAIFALIAGGLVHLLDKSERHNAAMLEKIENSVGDVWDAGKRSGKRERALEDSVPPPLAVVHDLSPR